MNERSKTRTPRLAPNRRSALLVIAIAFVLVCYGAYWGWNYYQTNSRYQTALQTVERREWKRAREQLKELIQQSPTPDHYLLAARAERRLENLSEAKKLLDLCQRLQGSETDAIKIERALLRIHEGELLEVEQFLRESITNNESHAVEILDLLSAALEVNYREAEAQRCLDELLRRQPEHFDALVRRGRTARNMGWQEDAIQYFQRALRLRPEVDNVRIILAETLVNYGHYDQAREQYEQLSQKQSQNPAVPFGLALSYLGTGESNKALQLFNQLIAANPKNWVALNERGKLAIQLDKAEEAVADLRLAESLAPADVAPTHLVSCLLLLGRHEEARKYQEKVARIHADRKLATDLGDRIREQAPNDPELRYQLGTQLLRTGKQRDGVHWLRTAIEKDPNHRKSHEALLDFFQSVNAIEQAEYHRRILQQLTKPPPSPR